MNITVIDYTSTCFLMNDWILYLGLEKKHKNSLSVNVNYFYTTLLLVFFVCFKNTTPNMRFFKNYY